jgi:hypothetical protein
MGIVDHTLSNHAKSYRVYDPVGETRHELKMAHPVKSGFANRQFTQGMETWTSWTVQMTQFSPFAHVMVNQFRHTNESGLTTSGSPHGLCIRGGSTSFQWCDDPNLYAGSVQAVDFNMPVTSPYLKVTFHAIWDYRQTVGLAEVWADDGDGKGMRQVLSRHQAMLLFNSTTNAPGQNHMRFGLYRSSSDGSASSWPGEVYMAGLTTATTRAAAEASAFG